MQKTEDGAPRAGIKCRRFRLWAATLRVQARYSQMEREQSRVQEERRRGERRGREGGAGRRREEKGIDAAETQPRKWRSKDGAFSIDIHHRHPHSTCVFIQPHTPCQSLWSGRTSVVSQDPKADDNADRWMFPRWGCCDHHEYSYAERITISIHRPEQSTSPFS